ncbi:MAG: hypothetical protein KDK51_04795 [Deltaproteobacteria bacterium]|nr:hypothetical protein [Deltaproteobacteria bacterium]
MQGKKINKETILLILSALGLLIMGTYSNCGMHLLSEKQNIAGQTTRHADASITETWLQDKTIQSIIPEIVLIIDYSGSINTIAPALKNALTDWLQQLEDENITKLCMGVMRGSVHPSRAGLLVAKPGNRKCYCTFGSEKVDAITMVDKFNENMDQAFAGATGANNGPDEAMLYSLHKALTDPTILAINRQDGCFSDRTSIVPVVFSDEQDVSVAPNGAGLTFDNKKYLPDGKVFDDVKGSPYFNEFIIHGGDPSNGLSEATTRRDYHCQDNTGNTVKNAQGEFVNQIDFASVAQELETFNGSLRSFGSAIGYFADNLPAQFAQPFWGGKEFADYFGHPMVDMRNALEGQQDKFQKDMNRFAVDLATKIAYFYQFDLSNQICDSNANGSYIDEAIEVEVDGIRLPKNLYQVKNDGQKIVLDDAVKFQDNAKIEITYQPCKN